MLEIPYARHEPSFPPRSAERSRHVGLFRGGEIVLRMENDEFSWFERAGGLDGCSVTVGR